MSENPKEYFYCTSHDGLKYRVEHDNGSVFNFTNLTKKAELDVKLCEHFKQMSDGNDEMPFPYIVVDKYIDPTGESVKYQYSRSFSDSNKESWCDPGWSDDSMVLEWFCLEMKEKVAKIIKDAKDKARAEEEWAQKKKKCKCDCDCVN